MALGSDNRTTPLTLRAHQDISGYRLVQRIGRGGVAEVWEAESPGGYRVALKLVHLSSDLRSGELRALEITRRIRHPSLLVILGTLQLENLLVISMELADCSLWDRFLEANVQGLRGIPRTELLGYLGSVADAIDYLNDYKHSIAGRHGLGVQHRDLKPQNILLVAKRAKVADFGLARVMERTVASHTGPCTLPYAAPEYFGGKTSRQSDQYALAVTYCQLRGGQMPFLGTTAQITFGHLCNAPNLEGLPAPERPIVAKALAKRPEERWTDCRAFIAALAALGANQDCLIPDTLLREEGGPDSESAASDVPAPSGSSVVSTDSDFTPIDTGHVGSALALFASRLQSTGARAGRVGPGVRTPGCSGPSDADGAGPQATWATMVRTQWARVEQLAARAGSGLAQLTRRSWRLIERARLAATPSNAVGTGPRAAWVAVVRAHRARIGQVAALSGPGLALLARTSWHLIERARLAATPSNAAGTSPQATWAAVARARWALISQGTAVAALALALLTIGVQILTNRARPDKTPTQPTAARISMPELDAGQAGGKTGPLALAAAKAATSAPTVESGKGALAALTAIVESEHTTLGATSQPGGPRETGIADKATLTTLPGLTSKVEETASGDRGTAPSGPEEAPVPLDVATATEKPASVTPVVSAKPQLFPPEPPVPHPPDSGEAAPEALLTAARETTAGIADVPAPASKKPTLGGDLPQIAVPAAAVVAAGEATKLHVRVHRSDLSKPVQLDFQGLPRGITVESPTIAAGDDSADLVLSAAAQSPVGTAEISVAYAAGPERGEVRTRINVLPPTEATIAYERGRAHLLRGGYAQAVTAFTEALWLGKDSFESHLHRGIAYNLEGHLREALADYDDAIRLQPNHAEAFLVRAKTHCDLGENGLALEDYSVAIRLGGDAKAYLARACLHHQIGAYDQALADYEAAFHLRPDDPAVHYHRGRTRYFMGDNAGAVRDFTEAIRLDPRHAAAYRLRGDAFARLGEYARAGADHDTYERLSRPTGNSALK